MRLLWTAATIMALCGCKDWPRAPSMVTAQTIRPDASSPTPAASSVPAPAYYAIGELRALGLRVTAVDSRRLLVCPRAGKKGCVCLEPAPCQGTTDCISFDENLRAFRKALAHGQDQRTVKCDRGEIGRCGAFRYFDFEGDVERFEVRW